MPRSRSLTVLGQAAWPNSASCALRVCKLQRAYLASVMGSPPVTGSTSSLSASTICGSFFYRRPPRAGLADAVGGPVGQAGVEFLAAAADGIDVQSDDEGDEGVA